MADFPIALTGAEDAVTDVLAKHINNLEAKVGIDSSAITTSHDYKLSEVTSTDKAVSKTATQTLTNKTLTSPKINEDVALTATATQLNAVGAGGVTSRLASKMITTTRDLTAASGDVAYAGVGFTPTSIICFYSINGGQIAGWGVADSGKLKQTLYRNGASAAFSTGNYLIVADPDGVNYQFAIVKTYDADGFTLTWTKAASATGTLNMMFLCFR